MTFTVRALATNLRFWNKLQSAILRFLALSHILYTVHQWLPLLDTIPMLVVAAAPPLMLVNLSPRHNKQSRKSMEDSVAGVFRPSSSLVARDNLDNSQYNEV